MPPSTALRSSVATILVSCFAALSGCQIVPAPGSTVTAEILSRPAVRDSLGGGYRDLHAAMRAGVSRSDVERGRLVRGDCFEPDPSVQGGRTSLTMTTLLPEGVGLPWPTLVDVTTAQDAMPDAAGVRSLHLHGRYLATVPGGDSGERPHCRPEGAAPGARRLAIRNVVQPWEHDFAVAEVRRHDQFSDAELAARRVVELGCRVEAFGDDDFMVVRWFARLPAGMSLSTGDVVRARVGAAEDSKDTAPRTQILESVPAPAALGGARRIGCR